MCRGITEIREHPVAEELGDLSAERLNRAACMIVICPQRVADLFSVELLGHPGGLDQVAEHHREVPPFHVAFAGRWLGRSIFIDERIALRRDIRRSHGIAWWFGRALGQAIANRSQQTLAIPQGDANRGQVLFCQLCKNIEVDAVSRQRGVQASEPFVL